MRAAGGALLVTIAIALGAGTLAANAADPAAAGSAGARIGRFHVTRTGDGIEIARPRDCTIGLALAAGGGVLAALGLAMVGRGARGAGTGALVLGLGLGAVGGLAALGSARWRANGAELVRERLAGRADRWPREAIEAVEVRQRAASAEDFKRTGVRPWDVRVRGRDGRPLPTLFALESESQARELARALGGALGVPVRED